MDMQNELYHALLSVNRPAATKLLLETAADWTPAERIEKLITPVMRRIGDEWERGQVSLAQNYMSGLICDDLIGAILPTAGRATKNHPPLAIVTLEDHHSLGRKIFSSFIRLAGFALLDYGPGVTVEDLLVKLKRDGIRILLISALMLRAALKVRDLVELARAEGLAVQVIVGGAPFIFDSQLWQEVGADAMASTASEAVSVVDRMVREIQ